MNLSEPLNGLLPIDKKSGVFSKDVSRFLQNILQGIFGKICLGHIGTLDRLAEGVLPILIGKATRLQDILLDGVKEYEFDVAFGYETETLDSQSEITRFAEVHALDNSTIEAALSPFIGDIMQIAPVYSSVRINGIKSYKLARKPSRKLTLEQSLELQRHVSVFDLRLLATYDKSATFSVRCSKGTYVRSLARDIAQNLNTLGTVTRLVRHETALIRKDRCLPFADLQKNPSLWQEFFIPINRIVSNIAVVESLDPTLTAQLMHGREVILNAEVKDAFIFDFNFEEWLSSTTELGKPTQNVIKKMVLFKDASLGVIGLANMIEGPGHVATVISVKLTRSLM